MSKKIIIYSLIKGFYSNIGIDMILFDKMAPIDSTVFLSRLFSIPLLIAITFSSLSSQINADQVYEWIHGQQFYRDLFQEYYIYDSVDSSDLVGICRYKTPIYSGKVQWHHGFLDKEGDCLSPCSYETENQPLYNDRHKMCREHQAKIHELDTQYLAFKQDYSPTAIEKSVLFFRKDSAPLRINSPGMLPCLYKKNGHILIGAAWKKAGSMISECYSITIREKQILVTYPNKLDAWLYHGRIMEPEQEPEHASSDSLKYHKLASDTDTEQDRSSETMDLIESIALYALIPVAIGMYCVISEYFFPSGAEDCQCKMDELLKETNNYDMGIHDYYD